MHGCFMMAAMVERDEWDKLFEEWVAAAAAGPQMIESCSSNLFHSVPSINPFLLFNNTNKAVTTGSSKSERSTSFHSPQSTYSTTTLHGIAMNAHIAHISTTRAGKEKVWNKHLQIDVKSMYVPYFFLTGSGCPDIDHRISPNWNFDKWDSNGVYLIIFFSQNISYKYGVFPS